MFRIENIKFKKNWFSTSLKKLRTSKFWNQKYFDLFQMLEKCKENKKKFIRGKIFLWTIHFYIFWKLNKIFVSARYFSISVNGTTTQYYSVLTKTDGGYVTSLIKHIARNKDYLMTRLLTQRKMCPNFWKGGINYLLL